MSSFNAKNLQYTQQQPAFLQRLRANNAALDGRNTVQIARPQKSRLKTAADGDEDEPVIVDEEGNVVGRREFEGMANGGSGEGKADGGDAGGDGDAKVSVKAEEVVAETKVGIGSGTRKRKVVKVVGVDDEADREQSGETKVQTRSDRADETSGKSVSKAPSSEAKDDKTTSKDNPKAKAKKIKLSFEDET